METPSPSIRAAISSQKGKQDMGNKGKTDRPVLLDISNDSPIVGVAMGGAADRTPLSSSSSSMAAAVKGLCRATKTPGSGEALLRGQVKTLLQKVEEEAELPLLPFLRRVSFGLPVSPAGLAAPTPANTPIVVLDPPIVREDARPAAILLPQSIADSSMEKKEEEFLINRLVFDSPGKSEASSSSASYSLTFRGSGGWSLRRKFSDDESHSSDWSLRVNTSVQEDDDDGEEEEDDEDDEGVIDDVCEELLMLSVRDDGCARLPEFAGVHTRFVYDSDDELQGEEKVGDPAVSPSVLLLRGLPAPQGKHLRFNDAEENEDDDDEE